MVETAIPVFFASCPEVALNIDHFPYGRIGACFGLWLLSFIPIAKSVCVYGPANASYSHALPQWRDRDAVTQSFSEITFGKRYRLIKAEGCCLFFGFPL